MRNLSQRYAAIIAITAIGTGSIILMAIVGVLTLTAAMPRKIVSGEQGRLSRIFLLARRKRAMHVSMAVLALLAAGTVVGMISTTALSVLVLTALVLLTGLLKSAPGVLRLMYGSNRPDQPTKTE